MGYNGIVGRRQWYLGAVVAGAVLLQAPAARYLAVGQASPDLFVLVPVLLGLLVGHGWGMGTGFTLGLAAGVMAGRDLGPCAFAGTLVGYLAGAGGRLIFLENPLSTALAAAALTLAHGLVFLALVQSVGLRDSAWMLGGRTLYHAMLAVPLMLLLRRIDKEPHP